MPSPGTQDFLPLNPRVFLVLLALSEGPSHGYAVKLAVESRSGGDVQLDAGALYRSIAKLVDQGLIEETDQRPQRSKDDARRRYYALTELGRDVVAAEAARLESLVDFARRTQVLGSSGAAG